MGKMVAQKGWAALLRAEGAAGVHKTAYGKRIDTPKQHAITSRINRYEEQLNDDAATVGVELESREPSAANPAGLEMRRLRFFGTSKRTRCGFGPPLFLFMCALYVRTVEFPAKLRVSAVDDMQAAFVACNNFDNFAQRRFIYRNWTHAST